VSNLLLALAGLALGGSVFARPQVIEPVQSFPHEPDLEYTDVALSGDWANCHEHSSPVPRGGDLNEARVFKRDATGKCTPRGELSRPATARTPAGRRDS
jgi:hypothetical protein